VWWRSSKTPEGEQPHKNESQKERLKTLKLPPPNEMALLITTFEY
jgi:hypothetical protein